MSTYYECIDCREVVEEYDDRSSLINVRTTRTRLGRFVHGLLRHGVWASSSYFERQFNKRFKGSACQIREDA